jgi:predicted DNA-binding transcriptional regulator AlpA
MYHRLQAKDTIGKNMKELPEKVTMRDIAEYLEVGYQHVRRMRTGNMGILCQLPEPEMIGNRPVWKREDIERWARETGRIDTRTGKPVHIGNHKPAK